MTKPTLFIVDDDTITLGVLNEFFEEEFEVKTFTCVASALEGLTPDNAPGVILTDIFMPDKDGIEFCEELRRRHIKTPLIIFSGKPHIKHAKRALDLGAFALYEKPFEPELLLNTIRNAYAFGQTVCLKNTLLREYTELQTHMKNLLTAYQKRYQAAEKSLFQVDIIDDDEREELFNILRNLKATEDLENLVASFQTKIDEIKAKEEEIYKVLDDETKLIA